MADITIRGEDFYGVPDVTFPKIGGGSATYYENGGGSPNLQTKNKTYTPTESVQSEDVTADNGYDGLDLVKITVNKISSSYIGSGVTKKAAETYHPSKSDQSIPASRYLTGAQTIKAVTLTNLLAENIKEGVTVKIGDSTDDDCVESVTGTYSGGSSKNVQIAQGVNRVNTTTYTAVSGQSITVAKTGTYDVYWSGFRSSTSGTNGSQLYIGETAYGTAQTTFSNHGQSVHLTNVSLTAGQTITVRARSRGSSYYMYVGNLTIIQK